MIDLQKCIDAHHDTEPTVLFYGEEPGFFCKTCMHWTTLTRLEFKRIFGKSFGAFKRELGIVEYKIGSIRCTLGRTFVARGRGSGKPSGSAKERRRIKRECKREELACAK